MTDYIFENRDRVRDYECDLQGIVNNANYQHYLEHSRHLFITHRGISFSQLHSEGIDVVVAKIEMQFKVPLRPDDEYVCRLRVEHDRVRYVFHQAIYRISEDGEKLCLRARVDCVATIGGKLVANVPELDALIG